MKCRTISVSCCSCLPRAKQLAAGMLGDLFSPADFGNTGDGSGATDEASKGGRAGVVLPALRPTGRSTAHKLSLVCVLLRLFAKAANKRRAKRELVVRSFHPICLP